MTPFKATAKFNVEHADTLVVHCSDHRLQAAVSEFLYKSLGLGRNYDLLALPGGPQCLTLVEYLPKFSWALTKWVRFLIHDHELDHIVLVAHQDCGWYKQLPSHLLGLSDPRQRQEDDLRAVRSSLAKDFPHLRVDLYYASVDNSNQVTIDSVLG